MIPNRGSFGSAVKKARLLKHLTQEQLAEKIDVTTMHMKQLESERRNPSMEVLYRLIDTLDLSIDSLFKDHDDELQELRSKISISLGRCDTHDLQVAYATIEAILNKPLI